MNFFLWVLQILFALHTIIGAVWKFSNSEQTVAALRSLPHGLWLTMGVLELICSLFLILPAVNKRLGILAVIAAVYIAAEMLLYCGVQIFTAKPDSHTVYWLVVAVISAFIVYGRTVLKPF